MKPVRFADHDCLALENDTYVVIVSVSVGPRILCFRSKNGANMLAESSAVAKDTPLGTWRAYGGHRLWIAPEEMPLSYSPDNEPVLIEPAPNGVTLTRVDRDTLVDRMMTLALDSKGLTVEHRLVNRRHTARAMSAWALSIMAPGGVVYVPQEPYAPQHEDFSAARPLVLWRYTELDDPRFGFSERFVTITPDPQREAPNKLGFGNRAGVAYYERGGETFVKRFTDRPNAVYPDYGSNTEVFTAGSFIELETLGPLETVAPNEATVHVERWEIHSGVVLQVEMVNGAK